MWEYYKDIIRSYPKISLSEERRLISKAQKGSKKSKEKIVLHYIGFLTYRIRQKVFPPLIWQIGDDLLEETIPIIYQKIGSYNLGYRDKQGNLKPVKFSSYTQKRIDGFIIDYLRKKLNEPTVTYNETMM